MITGFVQDNSKYFDINAQRKALVSYADERKLKDIKVINIARHCGVCHATARDYLNRLGLIIANGDAHA